MDAEVDAEISAAGEHLLWQHQRAPPRHQQARAHQLLRPRPLARFASLRAAALSLTRRSLSSSFLQARSRATPRARPPAPRPRSWPSPAPARPPEVSTCPPNNSTASPALTNSSRPRPLARPRKSVVLSSLFRAAAAALLLRARACAAGSYRARTITPFTSAGKHTLGQAQPGGALGLPSGAGPGRGCARWAYVAVALLSAAALALSAMLTLAPRFFSLSSPFPPQASRATAAPPRSS